MVSVFLQAVLPGGIRRIRTWFLWLLSSRNRWFCCLCYEVGVDRSEIAEDFHFASFYSKFCVALNRVELVINHASVGLLAFLALRVCLEHIIIVVGHWNQQWKTVQDFFFFVVVSWVKTLQRRCCPRSWLWGRVRWGFLCTCESW